MIPILSSLLFIKAYVICPKRFKVSHHNGQNFPKIKILGKSTLCPPKILVTNIAFLHLFLKSKYRHHILDFFCLFEVYWIRFRLKKIIIKKKPPTNIGELQHMKYICDKLIFIMEYEKLHT
jgi:hypothetical protein